MEHVGKRELGISKEAEDRAEPTSFCFVVVG